MKMDRQEMERRRAEKIERANQARAAAQSLSEDEINALVKEEELVKHLPVFVRTKDNKRLTSEQVDALIFAIRRQLAGEKVLDSAA